MIPATEALKRSKQNKFDRWLAPEGGARERLLSGVIVPMGQQSFSAGPEHTFFAIGSCFARNVEERLELAGATVLSRNLDAGRLNSQSARLGGLLNKYTPLSILQELQWACGEATYDEAMLLELSAGEYYDPHLRLNGGSMSRADQMARRAYLTDYFRQIFEADIVVITLGLIECWFDHETGVYLNELPDPKALAKQRDRFGFKTLSVEDCKTTLAEIHRILKTHGKDGQHIVMTVSPVPLGRTFSQDDIVIANTTSKNTLRAAAHEFISSTPDIDYFPSYEAVTLSNPEIAWQPDRLHASDFVVGQIIGTFLDRYGVAPKAAPEQADINQSPEQRLIAQLNRELNRYKNRTLLLEKQLRDAGIAVE
ncbi:GSCFA domain-containing protein [Ruegeria sp. PrR005]|uniref:GSCFA domain-containing protein n=1 Tax=Ruegeria sp. PrR005 TaxID=2706882 RepID=A0A6B2NLR0_9RHOB|nr:GSCFA domain-containing protein [Ruegeria sp. PrR005]NDW44278.1 GSCFA domain-containing protein [Ruegeria sp. PrR005]